MKTSSTKALFLSIATGAALALGAGGSIGAASAAEIVGGVQTARDGGVELVQYRGHGRIASRHQVLRTLQRHGFSRVQNLRLVRSSGRPGPGYRGPVRQHYVATGWRRGVQYRITANARTGQPINTVRISRHRRGIR